MRERRCSPTPLVLAIALLAAPSAQAAAKSRASSASCWDYVDCWSPFGVPGPEDDAYVGVVRGVTTALRFDDFSDAWTVSLLVAA